MLKLSYVDISCKARSSVKSTGKDPKPNWPATAGIRNLLFQSTWKIENKKNEQSHNVQGSLILHSSSKKTQQKNTTNLHGLQSLPQALPYTLSVPPNTRTGQTWTVSRSVKTMFPTSATKISWSQDITHCFKKSRDVEKKKTFSFKNSMKEHRVVCIMQSALVNIRINTSTVCDILVCSTASWYQRNDTYKKISMQMSSKFFSAWGSSIKVPSSACSSSRLW